MFKFSLGQKVYFVQENEIRSSVILGRKWVDYDIDYDMSCVDNTRKKLIWGQSSVLYHLQDNTVIIEDRLFGTKEALIDAFIKTFNEK